jgi:hypothetical protein
MTKAELRDHILRQLGIIGAEESPTAEDAELVETVIDNCQDELEQLEVALWPVDDVPGYAIESFTLYCKASLTAFGQEYDPRLKELGLRQLRMVTQDRRAGVGRANYF